MERALNVTLRGAFSWLVAAGLLFLSGCVQSVYPWYEQNDVVFDPGLAGVWVMDSTNDGKVCVVTITADPAREVRHYNLEIASATCPDTESNVSAGGQLFQVGANRYLDVWDDTCHLNTLLRVRRDGDGFSAVSMDADSAEQLMNYGRVKLKARVEGHTMRPDDVLIISEARDLRRFLREHSNDKSLFNEEDVVHLRRR